MSKKSKSKKLEKESNFLNDRGLTTIQIQKKLYEVDTMVNDYVQKEILWAILSE